MTCHGFFALIPADDHHGVLLENAIVENFIGFADEHSLSPLYICHN